MQLFPRPFQAIRERIRERRGTNDYSSEYYEQQREEAHVKTQEELQKQREQARQKDFPMEKVQGGYLLPATSKLLLHYDFGKGKERLKDWMTVHPAQQMYEPMKTNAFEVDLRLRKHPDGRRDYFHYVKIMPDFSGVITLWQNGAERQMTFVNGMETATAEGEKPARSIEDIEKDVNAIAAVLARLESKLAVLENAIRSEAAKNETQETKDEALSEIQMTKEEIERNKKILDNTKTELEDASEEER